MPVNNCPPLLAEIIAHKRQEICEQKRTMSDLAGTSQLNPSQRSLLKAMQQPGNRFILEYKKSSPSQGEIRPHCSPQEIAKSYAPCADAISVLTDQKFFSGSVEDLRAFQQLSDRPILRKDFFIDEFQVREARQYGADAILLMLSILDDAEYCRLRDLAHKLSMDVLTEVHTAEECRRATKLDANLVGINNRDLTTMQVDLATTQTLRSMLPGNCTVISESGIHSRGDVARLSSCVDGFLVGTSLMSAPSPERQAKSLVYGDVKICGVTDESIAHTAFSQGASYVGLVFCDSSPRHISIERAAALTRQVTGRYVGVFLNDSNDTIVSCAQQCHLYAVQLHGQESVAHLQDLRQNLPTGVEIWKSLSLRAEFDLDTIDAYRGHCDRFIFDSPPTAELAGGTGRPFDWSMVPQIRERLGEVDPFMIAGGIDKDNVHQLLELNVFGLDLSSGLETRPGNKNAAMIKTFFEQLRCLGKKTGC